MMTIRKLFFLFALLLPSGLFAQNEPTGFATEKGNLPVPITGQYKLIKPFGTNVVGGIELGSKGVYVRGKSGCQARAVYGGKVAAVYEFDTGYCVVIRHGSYLTVYARLEDVSVKQGHMVKPLANLGKVARDASGERVLHFQVRQEREALNPSLWVKW